MNSWGKNLINFPLSQTIVRRNPLFYPKFRKLLQRWQRASLLDRMQWMDIRLAKVLRYAASTQYGLLYGGGLEINEWPLLEKEFVRRDPLHFLTRKSRFYDNQAHTSGHSGTPLRLFRSLSSIAMEQAAVDTTLELFGYQPTTVRTAVLRGEIPLKPDDSLNPYWETRGTKLILASNQLNPVTFPEMLEAMHHFDPNLFHVYPSSVASWLKLVAESNHKTPLNTPFILSSSEKLDPMIRDEGRALYGTPWIDLYGQAERVAMAYSAENGHYYFLSGYSYIDLIPIREDVDSLVYEICGTSLWNTLFPLVRYRTGDLISVHKGVTEQELLEIKYGIKPFQAVNGRKDDTLLTHDGTVLVAIDHLPRNVPGLRQMQVVQESFQDVIIRVIPDNDYGPHTIRAIRNNAQRILPSSMTIHIKVVESLEKTAAGKTPFVISKVKSRQPQ